MTSDDEISSLIGFNLTRIETKAGADEEYNREVHEIMFLEVGTTEGFVTIVNHNKHNGYYGGFTLEVTEI